MKRGALGRGVRWLALAVAVISNVACHETLRAARPSASRNPTPPARSIPEALVKDFYERIAVFHGLTAVASPTVAISNDQSFNALLHEWLDSNSEWIEQQKDLWMAFGFSRSAV